MATKVSESNGETPSSASVMKAIIEENSAMATSLADGGVVSYDASTGAVSFNADTPTIRAIGENILKYQSTRDAWMGTLVNRIVYTIVTSKMWTSPYERFEKGMMELGETVEEVFANLIEPYKFSNDYAEKKVHNRFRNDVRAAFHALNVKVQYPLSVSQTQMRTAFLSWDNLDNFIATQITALYSSLNTDKFLLFKYMVGRAMLNGFIGGVKIPDVSTGDADALNETAVKMRETSLLMEYNSRDFNPSGVYNHTDRSAQTIILTSKFDSESSVKVLARAYNMDKADFLSKTIGIDSFAKNDWDRLKLLFTDPDTGEVDSSFKEFTEDEKALLEKVPAIVCDDDIWQIWTNFMEMSDQPNRMGMWWNYWLTYFATFSMSPFANAAAFCSETGAVTAVAVSPSTATLSKGGSIQLQAQVTTTGIISKAVEWSMTGAEAGSYVDGDGKVFVASSETATELTVTATSLEDSSQSGTATITVA